MKRLLYVFCLVFFTSHSYPQKTEYTSFTMSLGIHRLNLNMKDRDDISTGGAKVIFGWEEQFALNWHMEFNGKHNAFLGAGAGIRPLHKKATRFQPMIYSKLGIVVIDTIIHMQIAPEISLDFFVGSRRALGIYFGYNFILSDNAYIPYEGRVIGGFQTGVIYKRFFSF